MEDGIKKTYSGYYINDEKLKNSASGGLATAISAKFIQENGIVYGVRYSSSFRKSEFERVAKSKNLKPLRGSKYVQSHKTLNEKSVYKMVKKDLKDEKKVLFIALPCEIIGLKNYLKKDYNDLYTADLICHGPTTENIAIEYLDKIEKKYNSKIINFSVRYKKEGWDPPYLRADFENGEVFEELLYEGDYGKAFLIDPRLSCCFCQAKGINHKSDITLGDHWGLDSSNPQYNELGVSVAFTRSDKGEYLLKDLKKFNLEETDKDKALEYNENVNSQRFVDLKLKEIFEYKFVNSDLQTAVNTVEMSDLASIEISVNESLNLEKNVGYSNISKEKFEKIGTTINPLSGSAVKGIKKEKRPLPEIYSSKKNCCGCSACYSICPEKAIKMIKDDKGFFYPVIDAKECIRCYKCLNVCTFNPERVKK